MTTTIPLHSHAQYTAFTLACIKLGLPYTFHVSHGNTREMWLQVECSEGMDLIRIGLEVGAIGGTGVVRSITR